MAQAKSIDVTVDDIKLAETIAHLSSMNIDLQRVARIAEAKKQAAMEKAIFELQLATMDAERSYERAIATATVMQMEETRQQVFNILTAHLSPAHAAATFALFNAKGDILKLGCEHSDVYWAHMNRMMVLNAKMEEDCRAYMSEEASLAPNDGATAMATAIKDYDAVEAAMVAKDADHRAEVARLTEQLAAFHTMAT